MKDFIIIDNKHVHIPADDLVTVRECGDIITVKYTDKRNKEFPIERIDENHYIIKSEGTGELHEYKHGATRFEDTASIKASLERLRDYINTNVTKPANCKWLTLTYAENMTDAKRLLADFRAFNRRARKRWGQYEYIVCAEPQGRGAWHLHCVLVFDKPAPYMNNSEVREIMWRQGYVTVRKLTNCFNTGAYLTAYLGDMPFEDVVKTGELPTLRESDLKKIEVFGADGKKQNKAIIKGGRLKMYPKGFHIYRTSKGIKKPTETKMTNAEALEHVKGFVKIYEKSINIVDRDNNFEVLTNKRVFNKNPKAKAFLHMKGDRK